MDHRQEPIGCYKDVFNKEESVRITHQEECITQDELFIRMLKELAESYKGKTKDGHLWMKRDTKLCRKHKASYRNAAQYEPHFLCLLIDKVLRAFRILCQLISIRYPRHHRIDHQKERQL